jgi:hypothetical protein
VLSAPERAYQVIPNAANLPERSAVDILIVEDRRRQLVVNNDVEQVADKGGRRLPRAVPLRGGDA